MKSLVVSATSQEIFFRWKNPQHFEQIAVPFFRLRLLAVQKRLDLRFVFNLGEIRNGRHGNAIVCFFSAEKLKKNSLCSEQFSLTIFY